MTTVRGDAQTAIRTRESPHANSMLANTALTRILAVAVIVRALYVLGAWLTTRDPLAFHGLDSGTYLTPAAELLANGTFTTAGSPELKRTPGYPLLLLPGLWLGMPTLTALVLQVVLSTLVVAAVYALARRTFNDERIAIIAAAIYAVEPLAIEYTALLAPETLYTVLAVAALLLLVDHMRHGRNAPLLVSMAVLSAATYVRPAGYYLPFVIVLFLALLAVLRKAWKQLPHLALAAVVAAVVVLPWQLRNRQYGFDGFSAVSAQNLYFYNLPAVRAAQEGTSFYQMQANIGYGGEERYLQVHPEQRSWSAGERFEYMAREGARAMRENPLVYARIHLAGMFRIMFDPGTIGLLKPYRLYPESGGLLDRIVTHGLLDGVLFLIRTRPCTGLLLVGMGTVLVGLWLLAFRGVVARRRFRDPVILLLVACIAYAVVIAGGPGSVGRFRHPAMPLICVLAAAGARALWETWERRGGGSRRARAVEPNAAVA